MLFRERCSLPGPSSLKHSAAVTAFSQRVNAAAMAESDDANIADADGRRRPLPARVTYRRVRGGVLRRGRVRLIYPTIHPYLRELGTHPTIVTRGRRQRHLVWRRRRRFVPLGAAADRFGPRKPADCVPRR